MKSKLAMIVRRTVLVAALIILGPGGWVADVGSAVGTLGRAVHTQLAEGDRSQLKSAGPASIATAVVDVVLLDTAGKLPSVVKLVVSESKISRMAASSSATDGIVGLVLAADTSNLIRAGAANPFKNLRMTVGGKKFTGKYNKDLFGAFACGIATAVKSIKATLRLKGTTRQAPGVGVVYLLARVPLGALGLTPAGWI